MKKTVWYIRQWPGNAVSVNLVESYEEQFAEYTSSISKDIPTIRFGTKPYRG